MDDVLASAAPMSPWSSLTGSSLTGSSRPALREPAVSAWPSGPWDLDDGDGRRVGRSAPAVWPSPLDASCPWQQQRVQGAYAEQDVIEGLYADGKSPFGREADPADFTTYQYELQSDSLLPPDSYTQPPPDYPLYNWTLPYGPDLFGPVEIAGVAPLPAATCATPPSSGRLRRGGPATDPGTGTPSRAASDARRPAVTQPEVIDICDDDDDVIEVEVRSQDEASSSERITFDSIEEALASIEEQDGPERPAPTSLVGVDAVAAPAASRWPAEGDRGNPLLTDGKHDEVVKAAKSLFSKRTRTLYHWLYPDTSKTKLKATVSAAWDTLAEAEKQFYLSQVLGRFGLQASSLMINPQLDGMKGLPVPELGLSWTGSESVMVSDSRDGPRLAKSGPSPARGASAAYARPGPACVDGLSEAEQAVNQLFASCADSETWTSYSMSASAAEPPAAAAVDYSASRAASSSRTPHDHPRKRKRSSAPGLGARMRDAMEQHEVLKRINDEGIEDDTDISSESGKFRQQAYEDKKSGTCKDGDDFWRRTPDPSDIFPNLDF